MSDFAQWKKAYDDFDGERKGMGVVGDAVYKSADDDHDVTAWHDFQTLESARAFVESERLREMMSAAGVTSKPEIWFTTPT